MSKTDIKNFAIYARRELLIQVEARALQLGLSDGMLMVDEEAKVVNGLVLDATEQRQRMSLIRRILSKGFKQVVDEVAYTWFNRLISLRFMEVNGYLLRGMLPPFSSGAGAFDTPMLKRADQLDFPHVALNRARIVECLKNNRSMELYRYLMTELCNSLSTPLPGMFGHIDDATALLFPNNALNKDGVIARMVRDIPEEDWRDSVQIIGWLYQYYNTEPKDAVFAALKKNVKISKENIPAATQLFTPDWIVRYMVENSLGRLWVEGHPNPDMQAEWKYYLPEPEQEPEVEAQLASIRKEYAKLNPEDIRCIDPCAGSGHILVYMFDVLMQIYLSQGYTERDAVRSIICNNLYGLDIDDRAAQLAYFAVMMKAVQYDKRFLSRQNIPTPNVYAIQESPAESEWPELLRQFAGSDHKLRANMKSVLEDMQDAKTYGSAITARKVDFTALYSRLNEMMDVGDLHGSSTPAILLPLVQCAELLSKQYHTAVTNPPYMGNKGMPPKLDTYVKKNYPDSKLDLFAVFIERCGRMISYLGYQATITQHSWMFLSSFERLRDKLRQKETINMIHLGARAFEEIGGEVVQTTGFVLWNDTATGYRAVYCRLVAPTTQQDKEHMFLARKNRYCVQESDFSKIPGAPVAYWVGDGMKTAYKQKPIGDIIIPRHGLATSDNARFLRLWHEVSTNKGSFISRSDFSKKWFPMNKGGAFRKWYGNLDWLINYENDGAEIKDYAIQLYKCSSRTIQNTQFYFKPGITWSALTSGSLSFRWTDEGAVFGSGAHCAFGPDTSTNLYGLALLNSKVSSYHLGIVSPTLNTNVDDIRSTPYIESRKGDVISGTKKCISSSKDDWDSFETSWDFVWHPMVGRGVDTVAEAFRLWEKECDERFYTLKANEEELNRIFIDVYGLQDELTPEVEEKDVTVRKADLERDVRSLISYAVGCMFGRFSLDEPGLVYAGGEWDESKYASFPADDDNIIPIGDVDGAYEDDICTRFIEFVGKVYGKAKLEENLAFIANALGGRGSAREVIRKYFQKDFYADHCKIYQKRPIYWLFESGKKGGFRALIYLHRYNRDILARMRTGYVFARQRHLRNDEENLQKALDDGMGNASKLSKELSLVRAKERELEDFERELHHLADSRIALDLDDGVVVNYAKFTPLVPIIK